MRYENSKLKTLTFTLLFCAFSFLLLVLSATASVFAAESVGVTESEAKPKSVSVPVAGDPTAQVEQICSAIYKGDFADAQKLLDGSTKYKSTAVSQLAHIISDYNALSEKRESTRHIAYRKQLEKLEKFKAAAKRAGTGQISSDPNELRADANDIPKVLSVIAKVNEFADERQKQQLLSDPFVKQIVQKAKSRAAEYEAKGKWLDAYTNCYWWLETIEPNNEEYSDYAEQLLDKATIVASFRDSPCESRSERFQKVEKGMFVRAINVLNSNYVSIIDYSQMATKAIRRCKLLGEVIKVSSVTCEALNVKRDAEFDGKLSAWSESLSAMLDEVKHSPAGVSKDKFIDIFEKVLELNTMTLGLPKETVIAQFAEASLSALDPYTVMVWPTQVKDFERTVTNEFTGIGIEISKQKGLLTVVSLLPDTPAYNSGLDAGDVIEAVDGVETKDMTLTCAVRRITGPAGTTVTLTIRRPGEDEARQIPITRARITVPTIRGWERTEAGKWRYMIDDQRKIGYVRITSFSEKTSSDLEKVLDGLESKGLAGLILDLRFNSGGLLSSAIEVVDKFVGKGLIVSTRPRFVWTYASAHKKGTHPNYPLVILINRFSASASEIVSGALQDKLHKRAVLVGERTYGKGSVQGITSYPKGGAQLKYTMAYYHLPSGQRVESKDAAKKQGRKDWGIGPDIRVKLRSDELEKMTSVQRDNNVLVKAGHNNSDALKLKKHSIEETLAADPQLAVAVLTVRCKLIQEQAESVKQKDAKL